MNAVLKPRIQLIGIQAENVLVWWKRIKPYLERVIPYSAGEMTPELIRQGLVTRDMQLWVGMDGGDMTHVVVTQIITYQTGKRSVEITHCAGDRMEEWVEDTVEQIAAWGEENGCDDVRVMGRKGWAKFLPKFDTLYTVFKRDI